MSCSINKEKIIEMFSSYRNIAQNIKCPCRCRFCYEENLSKIFPGIKNKYISRYTNKDFDLLYKLLTRSFKERERLCGAFAVKKINNELYYFNNCDFFSTGLTTKQIEKLAQLHHRHGFVLEPHTTGLNVDADFIGYLCNKYPQTFNPVFSVITLNPLLRKKLMNPKIDVSIFDKLCRVIKNPSFFLLVFNKKQIVSDVEELNYLSKKRAKFHLSKLYYNKETDKYVKMLCRKAKQELEKAVYYFKINDLKLGNISKRMVFTPGSEMYSYKFRHNIEKIFKSLSLELGDIIICSHPASGVINRIVPKGVFVLPVKTSFGGCVDFVLGITVKAVDKKLKSFKCQLKGKKVFLPKDMFWIENSYDLHGDSVDFLARKYPETEFCVVKVPRHVTYSVLTLDECLYYYMWLMKK